MQAAVVLVRRVNAQLRPVTERTLSFPRRACLNDANPKKRNVPVRPTQGIRGTHGSSPFWSGDSLNCDRGDRRNRIHLGVARAHPGKVASIKKLTGPVKGFCNDDSPGREVAAGIIVDTAALLIALINYGS